MKSKLSNNGGGSIVEFTQQLGLFQWQQNICRYDEKGAVIPITLESLVSEWMHDWGNPKAGELVKEVYSKYGAMIGLQ